MPEDKEYYQSLDYANKTISEPLPSKITDIDTTNSIYTDLADSVEQGTIDISTINSLTNISRSRDEVYSLLDMMGEDPIISSALEIYASDVCEPNDKGQIVWAISDDDNCLGCVNQILDSLNVDKNSYSWVYSLCKYGDLYLRLYRDSEFDINRLLHKKQDIKLHEDIENTPDDIEEKKELNEDIILKVYSKNDRYAEYMEMIKNPAEVFDLVKFGKSYGYIKTNILPLAQKNDPLNKYATNYLFTYKFKENDIDITGPTEFVHASLEDNSDRTKEEVRLTTEESADTDIPTTELSFDVKRGQSVLYNSFKVWRELSLLENSIMLNRVTKSSILRVVNVEVGDMDKSDAKILMQRVKSIMEQKSAIKVGASIQEYTNPGPMENTLYFPVHEGKGKIETAQVGGDVQVGDLNDLDYWKKKLFASLGIPGQYLGDTNDSTGFNGGTSLTLISSRYAKTIKRIQNAYIQAITDAVNLILFDRGLTEYINKFTIRMQTPTTQEERDRKENLSSSINNIREIMSLLDIVEDKSIKLDILKSLLSDAVTDENVITALQREIDRLEEGEPAVEGGEGDDLDFGGDLGGGDFGGGELPSPGEVLGDESDGESEPMGELTGEEGDSPMESFYNNNEGSLLTENDLPSFAELGISFTDI